MEKIVNNYRFTQTTIAELGEHKPFVFDVDAMDEYEKTGSFAYYVIEDMSFSNAKKNSYTTFMTEYELGEQGGIDLIDSEKTPENTIYAIEKI